jgi:Ni/Fe-hydrogenase subunit HybB-like protein
MAIFGFVYAEYLMVLLLEIWFDCRKDIVVLSSQKRGMMGLIYKGLTLGTADISPNVLETDDHAGKIMAAIGIPSAFLLHGYVGFIFGSIKSNPWWGTAWMPVLFLFSAVVSGVALVLVLYMGVSWAGKKTSSVPCLDVLAKILYYALLLDFSVEILDWGYRFFEAGESVETLAHLVSGKLFISLVLIQVLLGTIVPLVLLGITQMANLAEKTRRILYLASGSLILIGIFAVRWNVVIGGQLFSKSLAGFTTFKPGLMGKDGLLMAALLMIIPFLLLRLFIILLPPWTDEPGGGRKSA